MGNMIACLCSRFKKTDSAADGSHYGLSSQDDDRSEKPESALNCVELRHDENDGMSTPTTPLLGCGTCARDVGYNRVDSEQQCPLAPQSPHPSSTETLSIRLETQPALPPTLPAQHPRPILRKGLIGRKRLLKIAQNIGDSPNLLQLGFELNFQKTQIDHYMATNRMDGKVTEKGTTNMLFDWVESLGLRFDQHEQLFSAMRASELVHIAEKFLMSDEDGDHDGGHDPDDDCSFTEIFRKEAIRFYLDDYCYIMADPWEDGDHATTLLDDYFVQMSLYKEGNGGEMKKIPLERSHNQLFDPSSDGTKPPRILVFGEGGTGKSTLCKKLAYDWAKGTADSPLKDVPVLCVVEFRKLQESDNIVDAIHNQLLPKDSDITPDHIRQFIKSNPSKIVIVLDGFDEFDPNTHQGDIKDLLNCKIMAEVTVLVTTRPWHACLLQKKKRMYVQICLEGFDDRGIDGYVRQYFDVTEDANKCLSEIKSSLVMLQFARIPILLLMICFLQKICSEDREQIDTLDSLFEKFLRAIFVNHLQKDDDECYQQYATISPENVRTEDLKEFWHSLGELALNGILLPGKKLSFSIDEIRGKEYICELGLKIGILNRQKIPMKKLHALESPKFVFLFRHFLFQEKCAGDFLASNRERFEDVLHGLSHTGHALSLQYLLAFCSGQKVHEGNLDNRERARKILHRLSEIRNDSGVISDLDEDGLNFSQEELTVKKNHSESLFLLSMMINYESQGEGDLLEDITKLDREEATPSTQIYEGMLYEYLQYFLRFAVLNASISLYGRSSMEFSHKVGKIVLYDLLSFIAIVYREVQSVLCTTAVDARVPTSKIGLYSQNSCRMSNIGNIGIVNYVLPAHTVNFTDLFHCISHLGFNVGTVYLNKCSIDHDLRHRGRTRDERNFSNKRSHLRNFSIEAAEESVEIEEIRYALGEECLELEVLDIEETDLSFPTIGEPPPFTTGNQTHIRQLNITYIPDIVPVLNLLILTARCCPNLKILKFMQTELDVPTMDELQNARFKDESSIEELTIGCAAGPICMLDFLNVIALLCPHLKKCGFYDVGKNTPPYETLFSKTFHEKTQIEDLEVRDFLTPPKAPNLAMSAVQIRLPVPIEYSFNDMDFLVLTGILCPNLQKLKMGGRELELYK